uniref:WSC domain-containing protein n=1 Tax=Macrostomum lignano TaxID=282301 RepID=A0A1I8I5H7_9PLAT
LSCTSTYYLLRRLLLIKTQSKLAESPTGCGKMVRKFCGSLALLLQLLLLVGQSQQFLKEDNMKQLSRSTMLKMIDGSDKEDRLYLERCTQSSQLESCQFAVDDDINQAPWSNECAFTTADMRPWFEARLENPSFVTRIQLFTVRNIEERGRDALRDFDLLVGDFTCARYRSYASFSNRTFSCDNIGEHIRVQSHLDHAVLVLCEVVVYGKVLHLSRADNGNTRLKVSRCAMSSVEKNNICERAIDNNLDQDLKKGACAYTEKEKRPWWEGRLEVPAIVRKLRVYNRADCCQSQLNTFEITVDGQLCFRYDADKMINVQDFECRRFGSRVRITIAMGKTDDNSHLPLCEVQLYGFPVVYLGAKKPSYIGCFPERRLKRDLETLAGLNRMSPDKCDRICSRMNKPFFGLQQGFQCWCGDHYGSYGREREKFCWMQCDGSTEYKCGAKMISSIFKVSKQEYEKSKPTR